MRFQPSAEMRHLLAIGLALAFGLAAVTANAGKHKVQGEEDDDEPDRPEPPAGELAPGYQRAPYLQSLGTDSVLVAWIASAGGQPALDYGTTTSFGRTAVADSASPRHVVTLRHLMPGTRYHYRVRAGDRVLASGPEYTFQTDAGRADSSFAFFVTGDVGDPKGKRELTANSILRSAAKPEFGLIPGDVVYPKGASKVYDVHLMRPWHALFSSLPVWPALGNHDWGSDPEKNWRVEWYLPNNEHYYSFDYGDAHFVALDSKDGNHLFDSENQVRWLEDDLRAHRDAAWTFVYYHHPGLTCTYKENAAAVAQYLMPLFDRYHVDVVFNGHAHTYERLYPIQDGKPTDVEQDPHYRDPRGTLYIVSGAGSKTKAKPPTNHCGPTAFFKDNTVVWTEVRVAGSSCEIVTRKSDNDEIVDTVTITKSHNAQIR